MRAAGAILALGLALAAPALADERILNYHSDVTVQPDGGILVNEHIVVRAEGNEIRRGIYRELPSLYKREGFSSLPLGFVNHRTPLQLIGVQRDGHKEPYHTAGMDNGIRIYVGSKNVYLEPGDYAYDLSYRYERILKFLPDHDELFWNVTGNDWAFPIDKASVTVQLPGDPGPLRLDAYTGQMGQRGRDFQSQDLGGGKASFVTTRAFNVGEGLSVVVGWPKGLVPPPTRAQELRWWFLDFRELLLALLSIATVFGLSCVAWLRFGVDPEPRPIVPRFYPPKELPPAAVRWMDERGAESPALVASLVQMAVQGRLKITEKDKHKGWILERLDGKAVGETEQALDHLFKRGKTVDTSSVGDQEDFRAALRLHNVAIKAGYPRDVKSNLEKLLPAIGVAVGASVIQAFFAAQTPPALFLGLFAMAVSTGLGFCIAGAWQSLRLGRIGVEKGSLAAYLGGGAVALLFSVAMSAALGGGLQAPWMALAGWVSGVTLGVFAVLLPQPSEAQQRLRDDIQGFTLYLSTAESQRIRTMNPPEETPALFEKYLPYALALEVGDQWGKRMEAVLKRAELDGSYHPGWISTYAMTRGLGYGLGSLGSDLGGSLSSSVSSASAPPSSSGGSGFGGGGSSGGGGGGGGGGGW